MTILDEGSFHDASIYKATPQPMALDNGIVYEAQTSGIPVGYATILSGANNKGWTGLGKWQVADEPKKRRPRPQGLCLPQATIDRLFIAAMALLQPRLPVLLRRELLPRPQTARLHPLLPMNPPVPRTTLTAQC